VGHSHNAHLQVIETPNGSESLTEKAAMDAESLCEPGGTTYGGTAVRVRLGHIVNNEVGKFVRVAFFVTGADLIRASPVEGRSRRPGAAGGQP
jgi:hypothetical protein